MKPGTKLRLEMKLPSVQRGSVEIEITPALKRSLQQAVQELLERTLTEEWIIEQYLRFRRQQEQARRDKFDAEQKQLRAKTKTSQAEATGPVEQEPAPTSDTPQPASGSADADQPRTKSVDANSGATTSAGHLSSAVSATKPPEKIPPLPTTGQPAPESGATVSITRISPVSATPSTPPHKGESKEGFVYTRDEKGIE